MPIYEVGLRGELKPPREPPDGVLEYTFLSRQGDRDRSKRFKTFKEMEEAMEARFAEPTCQANFHLPDPYLPFRVKCGNVLLGPGKTCEHAEPRSDTMIISVAWAYNEPADEIGFSVLFGVDHPENHAIGWHRCESQLRCTYTREALDCIAVEQGITRFHEALKKATKAYIPQDAECGAICAHFWHLLTKRSQRYVEETGYLGWHQCIPREDTLPSRPFRLIVQTDSAFVRMALMEGYKKGNERKVLMTLDPSRDLMDGNLTRDRRDNPHPDDKYVNALFEAAEKLWTHREIEIMVELLPKKARAIEAARHDARLATGATGRVKGDTKDPHSWGKRPCRDILKVLKDKPKDTVSRMKQWKSAGLWYLPGEEQRNP